MDNDDLDLVVTAINVQYEIGGNLAQVMDTIGDTIRERIRILRRCVTYRPTTAFRIRDSRVPVGLTVFIATTQPKLF